MAAPISRDIVTASNYGPAVSVITWILMVSTVLSVSLKIGLSIIARVAVGSDDGALILAMVLSIAQSVAVSVQIRNGIGRHRESLRVPQIDTLEKVGPNFCLKSFSEIFRLTSPWAEYSANLLFIASLAISKISILMLLRRITPVISHRRLTLALGLFITIWTVASLFASAFQCAIPNPWKILHTLCFNQISFWISYASVNLITETALIGLPIYTVWNVHISRRRKFVVIGCFAARLAVVGPIIAQLIQLARLKSTRDITFDSWPYLISNQLVLNLSVITVCVPSIKNFLLGLESGMIQTGDFHLRKIGTASNSTNPSSSNPHPPALTNTDDALYNARAAPGKKLPEPNEDLDLGLPNANNVACVESSAENPDWDDDSFSSQRRIVRTTEWRVEFQSRQDPNNINPCA